VYKHAALCFALWSSLHSSIVEQQGHLRPVCVSPIIDLLVENAQVGDRGTFFASDDVGGVVRLCVVPQYNEERTAISDYVFVVGESSSGGNETFAGRLEASAGSHRRSGNVMGFIGLQHSQDSAELCPTVTYAIVAPHDRGVISARYVADWGAVLTLCYDGAIRLYDATSSELRSTWDNERRGCLFTSAEVATDMGEVCESLPSH
jgi:hypothetical protein